MKHRNGRNEFKYSEKVFFSYFLTLCLITSNAFIPSSLNYRRIKARETTKIKMTSDSKTYPTSATRRSLFRESFNAVTALNFLLIQSNKANANEEKPMPIKVSSNWSATSGLISKDEFVAFDPSAYKAMKDDPTRSPLFEQAIYERLKQGDPSSQTVLDLGTGPYALFAIIAAQAGAGKVYAVEANPDAAKLARLLISKMGFSDVITVIEGFSSDIKLPNDEKVDFIVAEIIGSIASEEGAYATVLDARRFLKYPEKASSWIPNRIQTFGAPASYTLHNLFGPPEFDWGKLAGEPVRFNCRDNGLQLLCDPAVIEDISFYDENMQNSLKRKNIQFIVSEKRVQDNTLTFFDEFRKNGIGKKEAEKLARDTGHSFSGIAFWPRLILGKDQNGEDIVVNSRGYPDGGHQRSHWQTVLPIMADRPVGILNGGEKLNLDLDFTLSSKVEKACTYSVKGEIEVQS